MYEFKSEDVRSFALFINAETHIKGNELFFKYCPYCNGGEHNDKDTFSVNLDNGTFKCFRASCGHQGHFVELARDFNFTLDNDYKERKNKIPQNYVPNPNQAVYTYFQGRGISKEIVDRYKLTADKTNKNNVVFPFIDENGIIQFYKIRNMNFRKGIDKAKEWSSKSEISTPILFGMAQCKNFETLIITEGQIDSLSIAECDIDNAVSVPTGALGFTWLKHCYDWMLNFKKIIVFGDYENGEITLLEKLRASFPTKIYSVRTQDYLCEKDANAILVKYGKDAIHKCINNAEIQDIKHVVKLSSVKSVNLNEMKKIKTGIYELDKVLGGLFLGQVTLLSGKRGEGKSTFGSQLICEALEQGYPTFIYSGELPNYFFKNWLDLQLAGGKNITTIINEFGDEQYYLKKDVTDKIGKWYDDKAFIFDNRVIEKDEHIDLLKIICDAISRYDIKLVFLDNLMAALDTDPASDIYRAQSEFVKALSRIAKQYNVAILLVAHPKKSTGEFNNDTVSGSADITNAVDNVLNYERCTNAGENVDSKLTITKHRNTGHLLLNKDAIQLAYSKCSKRIISTKHFTDKVYGCFKEQDKETAENISLDNVEIPF